MSYNTVIIIPKDKEKLMKKNIFSARPKINFSWLEINFSWLEEVKILQIAKGFDDYNIYQGIFIEIYGSCFAFNDVQSKEKKIFLLKVRVRKGYHLAHLKFTY